MIKQQYVNEETGEVLFSREIKTSTDYKGLTKEEITKMLTHVKSIDDVDSNMLYAWGKITGEINSYGQFKVHGSYTEWLEDPKVKEEYVLTGMTMGVFQQAHRYSGFLMVNRQTYINTWTALYEQIGCTGKGLQSKLKKFLTENKFIREIQITNKHGKLEKRFILNPFLLRKSNFTSQVAIMMFQDFIKEDVNISSLSVRFLQSVGVLDL